MRSAWVLRPKGYPSFQILKLRITRGDLTIRKHTCELTHTLIIISIRFLSLLSLHSLLTKIILKLADAPI
jgi:hypothetical protein